MNNSDMEVFHLAWLDNKFYTWAETTEGDKAPPFHPFALSDKDLSLWLEGILEIPVSAENIVTLTAFLPSIQDIPLPSPMLRSRIDTPEGSIIPKPFPVPCYPLSSEELLALLQLASITPFLGEEIFAGEEFLFWIKMSKWSRQLIANQSYYPTLIQQEGMYFAQWHVLWDDTGEEILRQYTKEMPSAAFCLTNHPKESLQAPLPSVFRGSISYLVDLWIRKNSHPLYDNTSPPNAQAEWLRALTSQNKTVTTRFYDIPALDKQIKIWQHAFLIQKTLPFTLLLQVIEAEEEMDQWKVVYFIQSKQDPSLIIPFADIWKSPGKAAKLFHLSGSKLSEILFHLLGSISPIFGDLCPLIQEEKPRSITCSSETIYEIFMRKTTLLATAGVTVWYPAAWSNPEKRLKVVAQVKSFNDAAGFFSLDRLLAFDWKVTIGDETLTEDELKDLIKRKIPLLRVKGQYVILDQKTLQNTLKLLQKPKQQMKLKEILQQSMGGLQSQGLLPIEISFGKGFEQLTSILDRSSLERAVTVPKQLEQVLRPYQKKGVAWLWALKVASLNACLADDMGLGKTLQVLTLLAKEKEETPSKKPSLLICPTAVLENWKQESNRFTPTLSLHIHHGINRLHGAKLIKESKKQDLIVTSYALALRDSQELGKITWNNLILDEAQNIKNPSSKQTQAIKSLPSDFRVALSGTPIENHVGDLWSLFDFIQSGWLGTENQFYQNFYKPIQSNGNPQQIKTLKKLTDPFILRRVKTDPLIVPDLPDKIENKEYCLLTKEQVTLYESCLAESMEEIEQTEGISRKGKVLTLLLHLKQICNHPAHYLKESKTFDYRRSGKLNRLWELLGEILQKKEKVLLFTQFTEMGELIQPMLNQTLCTHTLFYHGGLSRKKRDTLVHQFKEDLFPLMILSLKAGGTGLNLTSANHVFHIDRWWNPAVENQATDRAFRIGQKKKVQVHKMICSGTMEEAMDELLEKKTSIADSIISSGESLVTEMSIKELRSLLTLRKESIDEG